MDASSARPVPTGLDELDRVLGGGLVPGSITLLGGEPGVGKSTLLLQVLRTFADRARPLSHSQRHEHPGDGHLGMDRSKVGLFRDTKAELSEPTGPKSLSGPALLVSAEESAEQVRGRAARLGPVPDGLLVLAGTNVTDAVGAIESHRPTVVVIDSVQTMRNLEVPGVPGSVGQVRACAEALAEVAKSLHVPIVLVSHVTKDGSLAGPRALEHLVDTVLTVEGDRHHALRLVRAIKHRFGPTGELGLFEMGDAGLSAVSDPYQYLLGDRRPNVAGNSIFPTVEGQRALLVEVQALTSPAVETAPARRSARGLDAGRLSLLAAVIQRRTHLVTGPPQDIYLSVVGGIRVTEPAADLAACMAIVSASRGVPFPPDAVAFGEVGLGGEIRNVPHVPRRLAEAHRVGFRRALVPLSCPDVPGTAVELVRVGTLAEAVACWT